MRKIEEAAQAWANSKAAGNNFAAAHGDFIAGARYVLDAMTSLDAIETGCDDVCMVDMQTALAAIRKEIEGE